MAYTDRLKWNQFTFMPRLENLIFISLNEIMVWSVMVRSDICYFHLLVRLLCLKCSAWTIFETYKCIMNEWMFNDTPARKTDRLLGERERNVLFNDALNTFFIYGYMASDIWLRTILIVRKETRCRHIGYSYRLTARVLLYAPSHRQDNTYHGLC